MRLKKSMTEGPITQPSCAIAHANDNTPDPTTAVIMCELVVQTVPVTFLMIITADSCKVKMNSFGVEYLFV